MLNTTKNALNMMLKQTKFVLNIMLKKVRKFFIFLYINSNRKGILIFLTTQITFIQKISENMMKLNIEIIFIFNRYLVSTNLVFKTKYNQN